MTTCGECESTEITWYAFTDHTQHSSPGPFGLNGWVDYHGPLCDVHAREHGFWPVAYGGRPFTPVML